MHIITVVSSFCMFTCLSILSYDRGKEPMSKRELELFRNAQPFLHDLDHTCTHTPGPDNHGFCHKAQEHLRRIQPCITSQHEDTNFHHNTPEPQSLCSKEMVLSHAIQASYYFHYALEDFANQSRDIKKSGGQSQSRNTAVNPIASALSRIPHNKHITLGHHSSRQTETLIHEVYKGRQALSEKEIYIKQHYLPLAFHVPAADPDIYNMLRWTFAIYDVYAHYDFTGGTPHYDRIRYTGTLRPRSVCARSLYTALLHCNGTIDQFSDHVINTYLDAAARVSWIHNMLEHELDSVKTGHAFGKHVASSKLWKNMKCHYYLARTCGH